MSKLVFIHDLFRIAPKEPAPWNTPTPWKYNAHSLYHLCRVPAAAGGQAQCVLAAEALATEHAERYYAARFAGKTLDRATAWAEVYHDGPDDNATELVRSVCQGDVVIGFDLSPLCKAALTKAGLAWICVDIHPVRFLPTLLFAWDTNIPEAARWFRQQSTPDHTIRMAAAHLQARYAINYASRRTLDLFDNSLFLLAQQRQDAPAVLPEGKFATFADFQTTLEPLCAKAPMVYAYTGGTVPQALTQWGPREEAFLKTIPGSVKLPDYAYPLDNLYVAMSMPNPPTFAGLTSKSLVEAEYFGAPTVRLLPPAVRYGDKLSVPDNAAIDFAWGIDEKGFTSSFWHELLGACGLLPSGFTPALPAEPELLPNTRLIFRNGGSDFDDATSFTQCQRNGRVSDSLRVIRKKECWNFMYEEVHKRPFPPAAPSPTANDISTRNGKRYALYTSGCNNIVTPAVVALQMFRRFNGYCDVFYVTDENVLSAESKKLLEQNEISILHSTDISDMEVFFSRGKAYAYLFMQAPELLYSKGYDYSLGIHADVIPLKTFDPWDVLVDTQYIAASTANHLHNSIAFNNGELVQSRFNIPPQEWRKTLINPGVVFNNNSRLHAMRFWEQAKRYYKQTGADTLLLNEESLYALFIMNQPDFLLPLDVRYNFIKGSGAHSEKFVPFLYHLAVTHKPWKTSRSVAYEEAEYLLWHEAAKEILGPSLYTHFVQDPAIPV